MLIALAAALAGDTWTTPHPGMRRLERTTGDPWRIHALEIDLCERGVSLRATDDDERQRTPSSFGALVGAEAVINGDFFSYDGYWPIGLAIGDGHAWVGDSTSEGFVAFGRDKAWISPPAELWSTPADWMDEAVGGRPLLVEAGVAGSGFTDPDHCPDRHPRTAVGLSRDRQTLWLVVVDGRSDASIGMTCTELATLMDGLGAWTALNLDGGGSTAMWVSGVGVVNDPSDGSERTVANHLAVHATGSGSPRSCDFWQDEVSWGAGALDDGPTDVDGDGRADACARAAAGLRCHPSTGEGFDSPWALADLADAEGWDDESNYATLRFGDLDGDGRADLCGRDDDRVRCWRSEGAGFGAAIDGPELADSVGWGDVKYWSTLRLGDVTGDGRADLCARAAAGWRCYPSHGAGFDAPFTTELVRDADGWDDPEHYGTLRLGDVDGDGRADLCARGDAGVSCWPSTGSGFGAAIPGPAWSDAEGWDDVDQWGTIRLVDVDGDGRADLCGRDADGWGCWRSTGAGFDPPTAVLGLSDASGWSDHANYASFTLPDLDGDGHRDLCARADAGVRCWLGAAGAFGTQLTGPEWSDAAGWADPRHSTTFRAADLDGDGADEICARGPDGLRCARWTGAAFTEFDGPGWSDDAGWDAHPYFSTLRVGGPGARPGDDGGDSGGPADSGPPGDSADPPGAGLPAAERVPGGGCGCASVGPGGPALGALAAALGSWLGRRRPRRCAPGRVGTGLAPLPPPLERP